MSTVVLRILVSRRAVPLEGHPHLQHHHRCHLPRSIHWSQRPACTTLVGIFPGLQTERKSSAFPAGSEGVTSQDTLLPLQGIRSGQRSNDVNPQPVDCAIGCCESMVMQLVIAGWCWQMHSSLVNVGLINSINTVMG
jgi:hypothetical protein